MTSNFTLFFRRKKIVGEHETDAYIPLCATAGFINEVSLSVSRCGIKN